jgi:Zn-dependent protease
MPIFQRAAPSKAEAMFGKRYPLFSILGIRVGFDLSWLILAALVVWTLAATALPDIIPGRTPQLYYLIAGLAALGLFASIVFHEFAHALTARYFGIRTQAITLFVFGGVAELEEEARTPGSEFLIAVAGPISSYVLAGALYLAFLAFYLVLSPEGSVLLSYLMLINLMLATFNLIPAFPLDGGRMLRALLWWLKGSPHQATRIAALLGMGLGAALMAYGVYDSVNSGTFGAFWQVLIGYFIILAARDARSSAEALEMLRGVTVERLMHLPPPAIPGHLSVREILSRAEAGAPSAVFPVVEDGKLIGVVQPEALKTEAGALLDEPVRGFAHPLPKEALLAPDQTAAAALTQFRRLGRGQALVIADGRIAGWLGIKDIFAYLNEQRRKTKDGGKL